MNVTEMKKNIEIMTGLDVADPDFIEQAGALVPIMVDLNRQHRPIYRELTMEWLEFTGSSVYSATMYDAEMKCNKPDVSHQELKLAYDDLLFGTNGNQYTMAKFSEELAEYDFL